VKAIAWLVAVAALIAIVDLVIVAFSRMGSPQEAVPAPVQIAVPAPKIQGLQAPDEIVMLPVAETATTLNDPANTPADDISTLSLIVFDYGKIFGGNPVGENDEITAALMGKNPKRLAFLPQSGAFLDASGRLIDRWGTPYFFHAISGSDMEISSAGPDLQHHTADDITSD
jgi:hypothetical protein